MSAKMKVFLKPSFHISEKSQTIADFTVSQPSQIFLRDGKSPDICPRFEVFVGDRHHFYLSGEVGNWSKAIERIGNELELSLTSPVVQIYIGNDHQPLQKCVTRREDRSTPNFPDLSATIPDDRNVYNFQFSQVGKVWDGQETVKSLIVWDFPNI